mgnify:CR=1 FL=1
MNGGVAHTPVINRPEVAIIGPNRIIERPMFVPDGMGGERIEKRKLMNLSISCDHRVVDGGRVFYTTLGHPDDFRSDSFVRMLGNAVCKALEGIVEDGDDAALLGVGWQRDAERLRGQDFRRFDRFGNGKFARASAVPLIADHPVQCLAVVEKKIVRSRV